MQPFTRVTGILAPLDRVNVDTDQIIPKQFPKLIDRALQEPGMEITIDLESTEITIPQRGGGPGWGVRFSIDSFFRECLLNGWDEVALTLRHETEIARYEAARSTELPAIA